MTLHIKQIQLEKTDSTNRYIQEIPLSEDELLVVSARFQTSGHGQKGNSWEAEEGKNLLISLAFRAPFVPPERQFVLSQAVSLSIRATLCDYIPQRELLYIKWPNDIYYEDKKICGFLVTCDWEGRRIGRCIIGIGLNINQEHFMGDAPNPISLMQIVEKKINIEEVRDKLLHYITYYYKELEGQQFDSIEQAYFRVLYHRDGSHLYKDKEGELFKAEITGIDHQGLLFLRDEQGKERHYAFKEVVQYSD